MKTTEMQRRENARKNSGKASRERHQQPKAEMDWDAAIARLKALLDGIEAK